MQLIRSSHVHSQQTECTLLRVEAHVPQFVSDSSSTAAQRRQTVAHCSWPDCFHVPAVHARCQPLATSHGSLLHSASVAASLARPTALTPLHTASRHVPHSYQPISRHCTLHLSQRHSRVTVCGDRPTTRCSLTPPSSTPLSLAQPMYATLHRHPRQSLVQPYTSTHRT